MTVTQIAAGDEGVAEHRDGDEPTAAPAPNARSRSGKIVLGEVVIGVDGARIDLGDHPAERHQIGATARA